MGTSCYKPKPKIRKSFSRIESFTNTWIRSGYLDLEEMLKEFKDARLPLYLSDQYRYDILWKALVKTLEDKPDELKSQTVKKLVRKGVADSHIKLLFLTEFSQKSRNYLILLRSLFPLEVPGSFRQIPTFSEYSTADEAVAKLYLNPEGRGALSRIMWVLNANTASIVYCPQIINVASLLLIYMSEAETFEILSQMIEYSNAKDSLILKYFTSTQDQIGILAGMAVKVIKDKSEDLEEYLKEKNINLDEHIASIIQSFGIGYFPLPLLSRILVVFLIEGSKAFLKIIIALFIEYSELIIETHSNFSEFIRSCFFSITSIDGILRKAFKIRLTDYQFNEITSKLPKKSPKLLYRPLINTSFTILKDYHIEKLWPLLPITLKEFKPIAIYSTSIHGVSLNTLLRTSNDYKKRTPMILLISTDNSEVFGGFLDCAIQTHHDYIGSGDSFVFTLEPEFEIFFSTNENRMYANVSESLISFGGGGKGPAICIDSGLLISQSYISQTYANKLLGGGYSNIATCELIALIH